MSTDTLSDIAALFETLSPHAWATIGVGIAISFSVGGAAWGIYLTGVSILGGGIHVPRIRTKNLISVIFCEAVAIYGIIMAVIFQTKIGETGENVTLKDYYSGFSIFWSGMAVGLTNIICGTSVGATGSAAAVSDAANPVLFVRVLIIEIFASALGLFGVIVGVIMQQNAQFNVVTK
eukprot:TRINITY_DN1756_c0_g1_i1.p1 TRINITY_DN1756_c0_g1~~TRINITY_DN1756_c0_g1_i1.p1  ORF type:complete len:177 (-),score=46.71 TRINITY_DN1756_c0_g1_i1:118-648(-)